jgi:hypothetical protein
VLDICTDGNRFGFVALRSLNYRSSPLTPLATDVRRHPAILAMTVEHAKPLLTRLSDPAAMRTFDITSDGSRIVFDPLRENSDILLIDLATKQSRP